MKTQKNLLALIIIVLGFCTIVSAQESAGRIYAKITLAQGEELEGRIVWGEHETIWNHTFDATYDFYEHNREAYWRQREYRDRRPGTVEAKFTVFFGDIKTIDRKGSQAVLLLKDGREFEVNGDDANETIHVYDMGFGRTKVSWNDIYLIQFQEEPESYSKYSTENGYPIYGKVTTRSGEDFNGFIMWDNDESLSTDVLDGNESRHEREIPFANIKSIRPRTKSSSEIALVTGREIVLSGSNDVNSSNKGLIISDAEYGVISIPWKNVDFVEIDHNVKGSKYSSFMPGKHLQGTVIDDTGEKFSGYIRWDDDEHMTTDFLNGQSYDFEVVLRFENIKEIKRRTRKSAIVIMKNGRELRLSGSNDVDESNKGIVILENPEDESGEFVLWNDFDRITFK
ncbi:hypothetical protein ACFL67_02180 [candidate division KSB1 bacterium]